MTPEQQAIIKALLAQQGQLTPMQQYQNAINNEQYGSGPGQTHPSVAMYQAGKPVAREPFDAREAMSVQEKPSMAGKISQAMGYESVPMQEFAPHLVGKEIPPFPPNAEGLYRSLSDPEREFVDEYLREGLSLDDAISAVLGIDMNAITRGQ